MATIELRGNPAATTTPGFGARLATLRDRWATYRARRAVYLQTVRELGELSDRDLADLGIHRANIRGLADEAARNWAPAL